jgi:hypothetical protein
MQAASQDEAASKDTIDEPQIAPRANSPGIRGLELIEYLGADDADGQSTSRSAP